MLNIKQLKKTDHKVISIGSHSPILQSMLDFDYLSGKKKPSLVGIVATGRKYEKYFWGKTDVMIPVYESMESIPSPVKNKVTLFLNATSGRRTLPTTLSALDTFPHLVGGVLFAENVPEKHAIEIYEVAQRSRQGDGCFVVGPASVGLIIPGVIKLGAIGGTQSKQLIDSQLFTPGNVAVLSSSGGMTNELIRLCSQHNKHLSFSLAFGGDRFPAITPKQAFLAAENDPDTDYIVYFGELGGYDEYELSELIKKGKVTKNVMAYIAGSISEMFETPPQFGHAKAMAGRGEETALAKRKVLKSVGVDVADSFTELINSIKKIKVESKIHISEQEIKSKFQNIESRKHALFTTTISTDKGGEVQVLGENLLKMAKNRGYAEIVVTMLLGRKNVSKELVEFTDFVLKLLVDHGPYVSGAVNTMVSARAGKDLVSSLVSGLLTIGPRFGGAITEAAFNWWSAIEGSKEPYSFIEEFAQHRKYISGIGHRKYRIDLPDPRVTEILRFSEKLKLKKYSQFALAVQDITTTKKANLILNVDGAIAAVLLDIFSEKEGMSSRELKELVDIDFFNTFFVLSRSVGFTALYLSQRRMDEGLFRLAPEDVVFIDQES